MYSHPPLRATTPTATPQRLHFAVFRGPEENDKVQSLRCDRDVAVGGGAGGLSAFEAVAWVLLGLSPAPWEERTRMLILLALTGCLLADPEKPSDLGAEPEDDTPAAAGDPECVTTRTVLALEDEAPGLGFSAADLIDAYAGLWEATFVYANEEETALALDLEHDGADIVFEQREAPAEMPSLDCGDRLLLGLRLRFQTADGVFDEQVAESLELSAYEPALTLIPSVGVSELGGSFSRAGFDWIDLVLHLSDDGSWSGEVVAIDEGDEGRGAWECGIGAWNGPLLTGCED